MSLLKSLRKSYWLVEAFTKRHYKTVLSATLIGILILGASMFFLQYVPSYRPTLRLAKIGRYTLKTLPESIVGQVSLGLVRKGENGNFQPGLASSWSVSDDGREYSFTIDHSIIWHDNKPLAPADIVYNFKEVTQRIEGNKLIYSLQEPFSPFLSALSKPILRQEKLGVGEYRISQVEEYAGAIQSLTLSSPRQIIIYKFYPTESSALTAYKLGEVDQVDGLSYVPDEIKAEDRNSLSPTQEEGKIAVLFFNNNDALLSSKPTRQALAYAITDKSFGKQRALTPIALDSWAYNDLVKAYDYDRERAITLFGTDIQDPSKTKIELKTVLQYLDIAEKIADDWRQTLGITVDVKVVTGITTDYQALLADYAPPIDPDQYSIWHSTQPTNFTHYTNLKVDKLLEDGRRTLDQKLRREIYQDFQRFLLEDSPAVFLFETSSNTIARKKIFQ